MEIYGGISIWSILLIAALIVGFWGLLKALDFIRDVIRGITEEKNRRKDLNLPSDNDNYSDLVQKNNTEVPVEKIIDPELKVCPHCAEDIKYNAIICRYCGKDINVKKLEIHKAEVSQTKLEKPMNSVIWIIILSASIVFYARETNLEYSIGYTIPWFVIGMVLSGIWWLAARKRKKLSWKWFDWLNVAAYIMLFLFVIKFSVHHYMNL